MTAYYPEWVWRERRKIIALSIRDGLILMLLLHAVVTIMFSPNRRKK